MLSGPVTLIAGSTESFQDREDKSRTVEYVSLTVMVGDELLRCTGKLGVLDGLNGEQAKLAKGEPVQALATFELRPNENLRTCRPRVTALEPIARK